jgi:hypothetical protein
MRAQDGIRTDDVGAPRHTDGSSLLTRCSADYSHVVSNAAADDRVPHGTSLLPRDLDERQLAAAPVLPTLDALVIDDLADDEDAAFAAALRE